MDGTIAWFDGARGYGFIAPADGGGDIFFSRAALEPGFGAALAAGDAVAYQVIDGQRGPEASSVGPPCGPAGGFAG